jgi:heat shock protein HtpX
MYRPLAFKQGHGPVDTPAHQSVQILAPLAHLKPPKVRFLLSQEPVAAAAVFEAKVYFSSSAIEKLDRPTLDSVVGHELGHVKDRPKLIALRVAAKASTLGSLAVPSMVAVNSDLGQLGLIALSMGATRAVYRGALRHFEYRADAFSVRLTSDPQPLVAFLESLGGNHPDWPGTSASLFLGNRQARMPFLRRVKARVFADHPPIPKRVARIQAIDLP